MTRDKLIEIISFLGLGYGLAGLWYRVPSTSPLPGDGGQVLRRSESRQVSRGTERVLQTIDWGPWIGAFRVHNPHIEMKSDKTIAPQAFPVVAFEVEALQESRGQVYEARFYDADGVPIRTLTTLVDFNPDYVIEPPYHWKQGARSHGWFLLPEPRSLVNVHQIVIATFR